MARESMSELSGSYAATEINTFSQEREEAEILWKLGRRDEAMEMIEVLMKRHPNDGALLEMAAYYYLDQNDLNMSSDIIERLETIEGKTESVVNLQGYLWYLMGDWEKAREVYEGLYVSNKRTINVERTYAEILVKQHEWPSAEKVYSEILQRDTATREDFWNHKGAIEKGSSHVGGEFKYTHKPSSQREYHFKQKANIWVNPWMSIG